MKTLKITFALLAVLLLTVSGQSTDSISLNDNINSDSYSKTDLLAHTKKELKIPNNG